jgi:CRISPR/Cas system CSM-associated protein Csm3 (group 7 of RAMP superfamily)
VVLNGKLYAESPIYRGNARKTLFTRDGDGTQRLVSLAGEIAGTAESLMDAFIGRSRNGRNLGLLDRLWQRLYDAPLPEGLIERVECRLREECYPRDRLFDLRMGIKLDEDRWAAEANANYKMETLYRNSVFDFTMYVSDRGLQDREQAARLYYILQELKEGRFWFGAAKSKGLGRCRLEMDLPFAPPQTPAHLNRRANHLTLSLRFNAANPVLVGWNWGKVDPDVPAFAAVEGRLLIEAMRGIPEPVRRRLEMGMAGPILSPEDFKRRLAEYLPRTLAAWLMERSSRTGEVWILPSGAVAKLGKGKYGVPKKAMDRIQPLVDRPFSGREAAEAAFQEALGQDAKKYRRVLDTLEQRQQLVQQFDREAWGEAAGGLGLDVTLGEDLASQIQDERALTQTLTRACAGAMPRLHQQLDQQIVLLQSDAWVDEELGKRQEHLRIKTMLLGGKIGERQWGDPDLTPEGVRGATWREFIEAHRRVDYRHMLSPRNLKKSIANDENFIAFLNAYRDRTRQELAQPYNTDFRAGGVANREVSRRYGKPYDTVFMRMLSWAPSSQGQGFWEVYIPGSTVKGAFRRRASQVLKTVWGETRRTAEVLDRLFGTQGQRGLAFFSDAYLADPQAPERAWCSMDGVRMDPGTGRPIEEAKADYLFAYGEGLVFRLRLDVQDVGEKDAEALSLLAHLLRDFRGGDIPLGGEKGVGFGWVRAEVKRLTWMTTDPNGVGKRLFGEGRLTREGVWHRLDLEGEAAAGALRPVEALKGGGGTSSPSPPRASQGFISHRSFGGYCGTLSVEGEALTPLSVQESGEPSYRATLEGGPVNGWDCFSMSPPDAALRPAQKVYALPSKGIRGAVRHLYAIASDSRGPSPDLGRLNAEDSLFGWVGRGPNQALMGRVSFSFGVFEGPELGWFQVPYPYGWWQRVDGRWQNVRESKASALLVGQRWRLFPHAPLAPCVKRLEDFRPDLAQASYFRAILPGSRCRFTVRFWNLEKEELQRLLWCVCLEEGLAHKMGKGRYLGFGSLRTRLLEESFLTEWGARYAGGPEGAWRRPILPEEWRAPGVIRHYEELRKALHVERL